MNKFELNSVARDRQIQSTKDTVQYVREEVRRFEGGNVTTHAYLSGQVTLLNMLGLLDWREAASMHDYLDNRQYHDGTNV